MKKFLFIVFVLLLVVSIYSIYGFAVEKERLTIWTEKSFAPEADQAFNDIVNRYALDNGIDVEVTNISWGEFVTKLVAAIEVKATPDICMIDNGATMQYEFADLLVNVSDVWKETIKQNGEPLPVVQMDATVNGQQYSIPMSVMTHLLFARKDLLDIKGLEVPQTWEDVLSASKSIYNPPSVYGYGLPLGKTKDAENFLTQILWAFGMRTVAEDGKTVVFNSPETVKGLKFIAELAKYAPPGIAGWDDSGDNKAYQSEVVAFVTNSGTIYKWMLEEKPDLVQKTRLVLTPSGPAGRQNIASMRSMAIFKNSKYVETAKKLLSYIMKPENYEMWLSGYGGYYAPAYYGTMNKPYWSDPIRKLFMENAKYGHGIGWPGPMTVPAREVYSNMLITEMVQMVVVQGKKPEEAVSAIAKRIEEIYARY